MVKMLSTRTIENIEFAQTIANWLGVAATQISHESSRGSPISKIIYEGKIFTTFTVISILIRFTMTLIGVFEIVYDTALTPPETAFMLVLILITATSCVLQLIVLCWSIECNSLANQFFILNNHLGKLLGVPAEENDEIEIVTTLTFYCLLLFGPAILPLSLMMWHYEIIWVDIIRTLHTGCFVFDTVFIMTIWYGIWSGLVLFSVFALTGLYYPLVISKWLVRIRWRPNTTGAGKIRNFHAYRCLQVLNQIWLPFSKPLVGILLTAYSVFMMSLLYFLISGGFKGISSLFSTLFVFILLIGGGVLFYAGEIFFRFTLAMPINSRDCWIRFDQSGIVPSKFSRAFEKSGRHISMYFGVFFDAVNPGLPLLFFRFILQNAMDLLIASR